MQLDLSWNSIGGHEEPDGYDSDGDEQTKCVADLTGIQAIADALKVTPSVTKILVGDNRLCDEGTIMLCDALRESKVTKVQELDLSENSIGPEGAKAVAAMAGVIASLTKIS